MAVTLKMELRWEPVDPDGSRCFVCEESVYFQMFALLCYASKQRIADTGITLCGSCYECLEDME